jgi:hypothetical protein
MLHGVAKKEAAWAGGRWVEDKNNRQRLLPITLIQQYVPGPAPITATRTTMVTACFLQALASLPPMPRTNSNADAAFLCREWRRGANERYGAASDPAGSRVPHIADPQLHSEKSGMNGIFRGPEILWIIVFVLCGVPPRTRARCSVCAPKLDRIVRCMGSPIRIVGGRG